MKVTTSLIGTTRPDEPDAQRRARQRDHARRLIAGGRFVARRPRLAAAGRRRWARSRSSSGGAPSAICLPRFDVGQRDDVARLHVGDARQRAEERRPEPAERRDARRPGRARLGHAARRRRGSSRRAPAPCRARARRCRARSPSAAGRCGGSTARRAAPRSRSRRRGSSAPRTVGRREQAQAPARRSRGSARTDPGTAHRARPARRSSSAARSWVGRAAARAASDRWWRGPRARRVPRLALDVHALEPGQHARRRRARVDRRAQRPDLLAQRGPPGPVQRRERRLLAEHAVQRRRRSPAA